MSVFGQEYSEAYDLLYRDKNYEKECDFIEEIWNKFPGQIETVLDLGCGTGAHAVILAERGYEVTGVDRSSGMLSRARQKAENAGLEIEFHQSSIQDLQLEK
ncbi:MAG: class I SAM-dependent methyltransferase, partial [Planctomycetota bacterium]